MASDSNLEYFITCSQAPTSRDEKERRDEESKGGKKRRKNAETYPR